MTRLPALIKYIKHLLLIALSIVMVVMVGQKLIGLDYALLDSVDHTVSAFALNALYVRVLVVAFVFSVGWKSICKLAIRRSGLDMSGYRWNWLLFYVAAELVIVSSIFGMN